MTSICMSGSGSPCSKRLPRAPTSNKPVYHEAFLMTLKSKAAVVSLLLMSAGVLMGAPNDDILKAVPSPSIPIGARPSATPVGTPEPIETATPTPTPSPSPTPTF